MTHADGPIGRLFPGEAGRLWRTGPLPDWTVCCWGVLWPCYCRVNRCVSLFGVAPKETPLVLGILLCFNLTRTNNGVTLSSYILITLMLASTLVVEEGLVHKGLNTALMSWIGVLQYLCLEPDVFVTA